MLWKLLTLLGVALAVWAMARRAMGLAPPGGAAPGKPPPGEIADLTRCPDCGAWRAPEAVCDCRTPPTP